jgi:hypothetical protein
MRLTVHRRRRFVADSREPEPRLSELAEKEQLNRVDALLEERNDGADPVALSVNSPVVLKDAPDVRLTQYTVTALCRNWGFRTYFLVELELDNRELHYDLTWAG